MSRHSGIDGAGAIGSRRRRRSRMLAGMLLGLPSLAALAAGGTPAQAATETFTFTTPGETA